MRPICKAAVLVLSSFMTALACSGANVPAGPGAGQTASACASASTCYPGLDGSSLHGQVTCLTQLQNGYCTHTCSADTDCCAVPGECLSGLEEVCASFESSGKMYCFVSCSSAAIAAYPNAGTSDPTAFCQRLNPAFSCRSTGGGHNNQLFCGG